MGYRAIIREIRIKNFRSIVEATIPLDNFNIFVGLNDCGKSNVLKALNLFFNPCFRKLFWNLNANFNYNFFCFAFSRPAMLTIIPLKI